MADPLVPFDLKKWTDLFPFDAVPKEKRLCHIGNSSPRNIAVLEQLRKRLFPANTPSVPTDLFAFAKGEPPRRDVTKWGGLPYRPAGKPWPVTEKFNDPYAFFAQFRFTESKDLLPELPGDILVVLMDDMSDASCLCSSSLIFEWYPLGIEDLVTKEQMPPPHCQFPNVYGVRHRTVDYFDWPAEAELAASDLIIKPIYRGCIIDEPQWRREKRTLCRLDGLKIGGLLSLDYHYFDNNYPARDTGTFLASIPIHLLDYDQPFPYVNQPEPVANPGICHTSPADNLCFADGFCLNFYLEKNGSVVPDLVYF